MALKEIPLNFSSPDFIFQIDLDGVIYGFRLTLNTRTGRYSLSIATESGEPIVSGVALTTNWKTLFRFKDERLPPGELFTMDITGGTSEPNESNLGDTVLLVYNEVSA